MVLVRRLLGIERAGAGAWRALEPPDFPFFDHEFLGALERSGSVGGANGWSPVYLVCEEGGSVLGAMPLYLKTDSYGEYVFDWEWAHAYQQHGLPYYPKLVAAVPFTPATGPKLLVRPDVANGTDRAPVVRALLDEARELGDEYGVSSSHALFLPERELADFTAQGFAVRHSLAVPLAQPRLRRVLGLPRDPRRQETPPGRARTPPARGRGAGDRTPHRRGPGRRARRHHVPVLPRHLRPEVGLPLPYRGPSSPRSSGR